MSVEHKAVEAVESVDVEALKNEQPTEGPICQPGDSACLARLISAFSDCE